MPGSRWSLGRRPCTRLDRSLKSPYPKAAVPGRRRTAFHPGRADRSPPRKNRLPTGGSQTWNLPEIVGQRGGNGFSSRPIRGQFVSRLTSADKHHFGFLSSQSHSLPGFPQNTVLFFKPRHPSFALARNTLEGRWGCPPPGSVRIPGACLPRPKKVDHGDEAPRGWGRRF